MEGKNVFYIERNGNGSLLKWLLGVFAALAVSTIVGAFGVYGKVAEMGADVNNLKEQVADLRRLIENVSRPR